jgi:glyoxylase-like metal-dependent hydrolase (beta-lactamase superfamily II)
MLSLESHGDVTRVYLRSPASRLVGYSVSAYLVRGTIVDSGFHAARRAMSALLDRVRPSGLLLTHVHEDHAGNLELIARRGLPVAASDATLAAARDGDLRIGFYRRFTWGTMPRLTTPIERFAHDALALVAAPGHSADHHVVWDAERETVFSGDLFLGVRVRVSHPGEDLRQLARTLRSIAALGPRRMFDAHRGLVRDPVGALLAKADWLDETIRRIDQLIADGHDDRTIRRAVLGPEPFVGLVSRGEYSHLAFVRNLRATIQGVGERASRRHPQLPPPTS